MEMIKTQDLAFTYPGTEDQVNTRALRGVDVTIERGSFVVILGHNGSGKSTLAKTFNAVLLPSGGKVYIEGMDTSNEELLLEIRRRVGMVFQRPNPFPKSIFENVAYGLRVNGITDNAFIRQRVEETLKGAALWDEVKDKLKVSAYALSGGQQQRLCIARAMAVSPSVLLMDEPASALDPISTAKVEELIHELKKQYTIVIVTHNMQQAARVSDNTAFFYMGQMVEFGDTRKIFTNPDKVETQNYITGRFG